MAMAIHRTRLIRGGMPMHMVIADLVKAWGLGCRILPMSDEPVRTVIHGPEGPIPFQDYMVKLRTDVEVKRVEFTGADFAPAAPGVVHALAESDTIVIAPSNPIVSIGPILSIRPLREALATAKGTRVAISPIIAGQVVKGPAAKMLESLGHEVSALGVARIYAGMTKLIDVMIIDELDRELAPVIERELGIKCIVMDTMMTSDEKKQALALAAISAQRRR
jgi:LPPG:FO 2-phospho-L-lactate transferase